ncbi:MAG: ferredoxin [Candidatus Woesearchaeota archaeon]
MTKYKVEVDTDACIGCRACTVICDNFVPNGDKVKVVNSTIEQADFKLNKEAEEGCPVQAIKITKLDE